MNLEKLRDKIKQDMENNIYTHEFKSIMKSQLLDIEDELMYCDKLIRETNELLQNVNTMSGSAEEIVDLLTNDIRKSLVDLVPPLKLNSDGIEVMQMEVNDKINFINALYQDVITEHINWNTNIKVIYKNGKYHYENKEERKYEEII